MRTSPTSRPSVIISTTTSKLPRYEIALDLDSMKVLAKHQSQAYIHTRMRKRTADFLQGTYQSTESNHVRANFQQCSTELGRRMKSVSVKLPVVVRSEFRVRIPKFFVHICSQGVHCFVCMSQFEPFSDTPPLRLCMLEANMHPSPTNLHTYIDKLCLGV